ncbi:hypothetical protein BJ165DRAFT_1434680 [Panaeolus papilionaceus]|nr:hypothetical protein BJ165DRAFT_1434680 [Panaeolus papilionaceus]
MSSSPNINNNSSPPPTTTTSTSPTTTTSNINKLDDEISNTNNNNDSQQPLHKCLWQDCTQAFVDPETLYNHLCNDHIGRKSTNNLCLTCKWKDCGTSCAKRDHITSHLRVHTPLKPHVCEVHSHFSYLNFLVFTLFSHRYLV